MRKVLALLLLTACTDPVRSAAIDALGPEDPKVPEGPNHRPGQDCLVCHSEGGPASGTSFAIAGTVFKTNQAGSPGAPNIVVGLIDSAGGSPLAYPVTNDSGNFWVPLSDWPNEKLKFPIRPGLYQGPELKQNQTPLIVMKSLVGRNGSCNYCHRANIARPTDAQVDESASSAGQIYLQLGSTP